MRSPGLRQSSPALGHSRLPPALVRFSKSVGRPHSRCRTGGREKCAAGPGRPCRSPRPWDPACPFCLSVRISRKKPQGTAECGEDPVSPSTQTRRPGQAPGLGPDLLPALMGAFHPGGHVAAGASAGICATGSVVLGDSAGENGVWGELHTGAGPTRVREGDQRGSPVCLRSHSATVPERGAEAGSLQLGLGAAPGLATGSRGPASGL